MQKRRIRKKSNRATKDFIINCSKRVKKEIITPISSKVGKHGVSGKKRVLEKNLIKKVRGQTTAVTIQKN